MRFELRLTAFALAAIAAGGACGEELPSDTAAGAGGAGGSPATADAGSVYGLALVNPNCGSGDGGTGIGECTQCATDQCAAQLAECFGAAWQSDLQGGVCSDFGACVMACSCGDNDCFNGCVAELESAGSEACRACLTDLVACEQEHCAAQCESVSPDGGQGTGGVGAHGPGGG